MHTTHSHRKRTSGAKRFKYFQIHFLLHLVVVRSSCLVLKCIPVLKFKDTKKMHVTERADELESLGYITPTAKTLDVITNKEVI